MSLSTELYRAALPPESISSTNGCHTPYASTAACWVASVVEKLTDEARSMIGANHAATHIAVDERWSEVISANSFSEKYSSWRFPEQTPDNLDDDSSIVPLTRPTRLTHAELVRHPVWLGIGKTRKRRLPLQGWLAVPLVNRHGRNFGTIELCDKDVGEFTTEDEFRLIQFAKITSLAVENAWLYVSARDGKRGPMKTSSFPMLHAELGEILGRDCDVHQTLQACAELIVQQADVALARIWVCHGVLSELQASAGLVMHHDDARAQIPIGQFSIGHIARTRQPLVTDAILDNPNIHDKEWSRREGLNSFAGIPLLVDNELQGVLAMFDRKPLSGPVLESLKAAAADIALVIKRHRAQLVSDCPNAPTVSPETAIRSEHAVITAALNGVITDWNTGAELFLGYRHNEMLGQPLTFLIPADKADEHREMTDKVARGETVTRGETILVRKGGRRLEARLTVSAQRDALGRPTGMIVVADDIADLKRLEQHYNQAQKMEVFGQLAGGVAHDFNNLLTVILGYSEIVISRLKVSDSSRDLVGEIQKAGLRAETLTRQLLAFSRKKKLEPKVLDLNAVVSDTEKMLRRLIGEDILMTAIFAPALKPVKIDPGQLQQVLLNLAVNARDAMPRGGRLTIETDNVTLDETYAHTHPQVRPGDYVVLAISDTGVGMDPATKARIFEPLFTTKGPGKGTGLGLTTVISILKQNGGFIEVFSELGRGTTFKVFMPQVQEAFPHSKSHPHLRTIPRGKETVLLVEDEHSVRTLAKHVLQICGYTVIEAMDGEEALRAAESHKGAIDLMVSDVVLPHLGGGPLAERLLAIKPQLKVLFLSGYTNDAVARNGVVESEYAFLQKPFSTGALAQKVREVLDQPARFG